MLDKTHPNNIDVSQIKSFASTITRSPKKQNTKVKESSEDSVFVVDSKLLSLGFNNNMRSKCNQKKKMNITLGHSSSYEYPEKKRGSIEELHKRNQTN